MIDNRIMKYVQNITTCCGKKVGFVWMKGVNDDNYHPITQAYGVIMDKNKNILLGRKKGVKDWALLGGTIERGETPLEALKRELMEEVDIEVKQAIELGLQKAYVVGKEDEAVYQSRFLVYDFKLKKQTIDPDTGIFWERKFFPADRIDEYLEWGKTGRAIIKDALELYSSLKPNT